MRHVTRSGTSLACIGPPRIGTAGWSIPASLADLFAPDGSHLARYGARLNCVEINSSFYRPHRRQTYERWATSTPGDFRFSVKLPKTVTHEHRLAGCEALLDRFLGEAGGLHEKLAVLLVQLPPSLAFDGDVAPAFFRYLRRHAKCQIACEPRHASWFSDSADSAMAKLHVSRVAADPPRAAGDGSPGGWQDFAYYRMHGSPRIYYSDYDDERLAQLAQRLASLKSCWCIFDNTAAFAALRNALTLQALAAGNATAPHL